MELLNNEKETIKLGKKIAKKLKSGDILCLEGDLGSGKTTLVKGIAKGLKIKEEITSPTFVLMNIYNTKKINLIHIDTYRLENEGELKEIGVEDYIGKENNITIIEWPKKIPKLLKNKKIKKLILSYNKTKGRNVEFSF